jgi:hypothetical protein
MRSGQVPVPSSTSARPPDGTAPERSAPVEPAGSGPAVRTDGMPMATAGPILAAVAPTPTTSGTTTTTTMPPAPVEQGARPVPPARPVEPPPGPATAYPTSVTPAGYLATDVGCAAGTSAAALDAFFRERIGPVIGHDYQHVYPLGGDRSLWLFQDTFIDHTGRATRLEQAAFAHNTALVQQGDCFTLLHRGTAAAPTSFEPGTGDEVLSRWFWPLGGELKGGRLQVFWAEMAKTSDPRPPDGLGWLPVRTWLATYDAATLERASFQPAPAAGVHPIYGYAVASDADHSYLFGNSFDQNLAHQGGYHACPCSATAVYLARVPRGALDQAPEFRTRDGWSADPGAAEPIVDRYRAENPMQPRFVADRWVAVTKVDGYWGDDLAVDVAIAPWGPWTTVSRRSLPPRGGDPLMNTYHAHLMPWTNGGLVVGVSQNARDMLRDAWPRPDRYRLQFLSHAVPEVPRPDPPPTSTTSTTATTATTEVATTTSAPTTTVAAPTTAETATTTSTDPPACATTTLGPATTTASSSSTSAASSSTSTTTPCRG